MLYDGDCSFCQKWVRRWSRITGDCILYRPYQSVLADFSDITEDECKEAVQLVEVNGERSSAAKAVLRALAISGRYKWLFYLYLNVPLVSYVSEKIYRCIARNRTKLSGKQSQCDREEM